MGKFCAYLGVGPETGEGVSRHPTLWQPGSAARLDTEGNGHGLGRAEALGENAETGLGGSLPGTPRTIQQWTGGRSYESAKNLEAADVRPSRRRTSARSLAAATWATLLLMHQS